MGPLAGYTIIELAGLGPAPMAGMMLADMGANVIRVEKSIVPDPLQTRDVSFRGKKSIVLDLRAQSGREILFKLVEKADALIEGYRPGVTERIGVGPEDCWQRNPKLVYGRMTGWGQDGPLAGAAGHDINYIALAGALYACGRPGEIPSVPLNLVGDMGGGGMLLLAGVLAALLEAGKSGKGQVVDAAMVDGTAQLMWMLHSLQAQGNWDAEQRGVNLLDGGAHFYDCYATRDGKFIAVGAIETQFYELLINLCGAPPDLLDDQMDRSLWPQRKKQLAAIFRTRTQQEWCDLLEGTDACYAPVLSANDAVGHPHNRARGTYVELDGFTQPAPAPRFSRTKSKIRHGQRQLGEDGESILRGIGYSDEDIGRLLERGVLKLQQRREE